MSSLSIDTLSRTRVKFCGITSVSDAVDAVNCGIDAIGLNFYARSARYIEIDAAEAILAALPAYVTTVGLFINAEASQVEEVLSRVPLDLLQFHGDETPEYCGQFGRPYVKAIRGESTAAIVREAERFPAALSLLIDTATGEQFGGTGDVFDWRIVPPLSKTIVLAGGLSPANVGKAIEQVGPYSVDVSSGIEASKGVKDIAKMKQFMAAVRAADMRQS